MHVTVEYGRLEIEADVVAFGSLGSGFRFFVENLCVKPIALQVGRYVQLRVDENHGGDGTGIFRAFFSGYKAGRWFRLLGPGSRVEGSGFRGSGFEISVWCAQADGLVLSVKARWWNP